MIKFFKNLFKKPQQFKVGQIVEITKPVLYFSYLPVGLNLLPKYWIIEEIRDNRLALVVNPVIESKIVKNKIIYYPKKVEVEDGHVKLAPEIVQILFGK